MKIGILTFHWATNYGAVLQAYALQTFLEKKGHSVSIINYKPLQFDHSIKSYIIYPRLLKKLLFRFSEVKRELIKDHNLEIFRKKHLHLTKRLYSWEDVSAIVDEYDILISGSDQVLNPYFTTQGENKPTSVYFLSFSCYARKIGYAVSFGCTEFPEKAAILARQWIHSFDIIGTRENSGISILDQLNYDKNRQIVPDPTILCGKLLFANINIKIKKENYTYVYLLRNKTIPVDYKALRSGELRYSDTNAFNISLTHWLEEIGSCSFLITNSYHGMIMALLFHVPFAVLLENEENVGMNDRFFTLLSKLNLLDRIAENSSESINVVLSHDINWTKLDNEVDSFRKEGESFLAL